MIDLILIATMVTQPSPQPRKPTDDRRDLSATLSQIERSQCPSFSGQSTGFYPSPNRNSKRIVPIMTSTQYIADHIDRIDRRHGGKQNLILDSKWRIASHLDFENLNPDGTLTPDQLAKVDNYIAKFKSTPAGKSAIAEYRRVG